MAERMKSLIKITLLLVFTGITVSGNAQYLRTSYFMEGATNRLQLNPALQPTRGYINIPAAGSITAATSSNVFGVSDIIDIVDSETKFLKSDKLFNRLENNNWLNAYVNTDIISFGFHKGKGFWSGNIGLRTDIGFSLPKSRLEYMRHRAEWEDGLRDGEANFNMRNQTVNVNAYTEVGIGYSRILTDKLTVGAKVKALLGVANMNLDIRKMDIREKWGGYTTDGDGGYYEREEAWVDRDISLEISMAGMGLTMEPDEETGEDVISDIDFDKFGFAGYGFGIDLGATYKITNNLIVSASILDLGFISWKKGSTQIASSKGNDYYEDGLYDVGEIIDVEAMWLTLDESKSRKTSLASTLVLGAEYGFLNNKLSAGILSTTRFGKPETISEITISGNYRPKSWLDASLSYSVLQSEFKTFGIALRMGPLFIGSDYMYTGNDSGAKGVNAYLGISVPLGKKKMKD